MGYPIQQNTAVQALAFFLTASSDHISGLTGKAGSVVVKIRKAGGSSVTPSGAVAEVDATNMPGWYEVAAHATDSNTLGPLLLHAKDAASDPYDDLFPVVAYNPQATSLGLSLAKTTNVTGFNDIAATAIVTGGAIATAGGAVSTVTTTTTATNLTNLPAAPADWLAAAAVKADAVTKIQAGLSTYAGADTAGTTTLLTRLGAPAGASLAADVAAVAAKTGNLPADPADASDIATAFAAVPGAAVTAIKADADFTTLLAVGNSLDTMIVADGAAAYEFTAGALANAPTGGTAPTAAEVRQEMDANSTKFAAIVADTNELQVDWANGGRLDLILDTAAVKTGMKLASDGLDAIPTTYPAGVADTFPKMLVQTFYRFFGKATRTDTQIKTYASDGSTIVTTQTISDDGTVETQGVAT